MTPICSPNSWRSCHNHDRTAVVATAEPVQLHLVRRAATRAITRNARANKCGNEPNIVGPVDECRQLIRIFAVNST